MYAVKTNTDKFGIFTTQTFSCMKTATVHMELIIEQMWNQERDFVHWDDIHQTIREIENAVEIDWE